MSFSSPKLGARSSTGLSRRKSSPNIPYLRQTVKRSAAPELVRRRPQGRVGHEVWSRIDIGSDHRAGGAQGLLLLEYIQGSMPVDPAALHDKVHLRRRGNILQGVSWHRDDVGQPARCNRAEIIALQQFCCGARPSLQSAAGRDTSRHHRLKLENAFVEREHAAIRPKGYFRFASCDALLCVFDRRYVATEFPDRVLGKPTPASLLRQGSQFTSPTACGTPAIPFGALRSI